MSETLARFQSLIRKVPVSAREYYQMDMEARQNAFTVSKVARIEQIKKIQKSLAEALKEGTSLDNWKNLNFPTLKKLDEAHQEVVFRNAIQDSYAKGRYSQQTKHSTSRPYLQYITAGDHRVRPSHRALDGKTFPIHHSFWETNYPPNGHRCRCTTISLTSKEAEQLGIDTEIPPSEVEWKSHNGKQQYQPILDQWDKETKHVYQQQMKQLEIPQTLFTYRKGKNLEEIKTHFNEIGLKARLGMNLPLAQSAEQSLFLLFGAGLLHFKSIEIQSSFFVENQQKEIPLLLKDQNLYLNSAVLPKFSPAQQLEIILQAGLEQAMIELRPVWWKNLQPIEPENLSYVQSKLGKITTWREVILVVMQKQVLGEEIPHKLKNLLANQGMLL